MSFKENCQFYINPSTLYSYWWRHCFHLVLQQVILRFHNRFFRPHISHLITKTFEQCFIYCNFIFLMLILYRENKLSSAFCSSQSWIGNLLFVQNYLDRHCIAYTSQCAWDQKTLYETVIISGRRSLNARGIHLHLCLFLFLWYILWDLLFNHL